MKLILCTIALIILAIIFICIYTNANKHENYILDKKYQEYIWSKGIDKDNYQKTTKGTESIISNHSMKKYIINTVKKNKPYIWIRLSTRSRHNKHNDLDSFTKNINLLKYPIILVTSDGDASVPTDINIKTLDILHNSPLIKIWYTQNFDQLTHYKQFIKKIRHYPIGFDLHTVRHESLNTPNKIISTMIQLRNTSSEKPLSIFCDLHNSKTDKATGGQRSRIYPILKNTSHVVFLENRVTPKELWKKYANDHTFIISTHGNGLDCHRTWEILLLGGIVITKKSSLDPMFKDLPVVLVDDWDECKDYNNLKKWKAQFYKLASSDKIIKMMKYKYWLNI